MTTGTNFKAVLASCAIALPVAGGIYWGAQQSVYGEPQSRPSTHESSLWNALRIQADWLEGYDSVSALARGADAVVIGTPLDFLPSKVIQGDAPEDVVVYAKLVLRVERVVRGHVGDTVDVEFLVPLLPAAAAAVIAEQARALPTEPVMLFLRLKSDDQGLYRIVNDVSVWEAKDGVVSAPLSEAPVEDEHEDSTKEAEPAVGFGVPTEYAAELSGVTSLDELADIAAQ